MEQDFLKIRNPKVSIIIATFNSVKTLRTALDSVCNQSYKDWECIVVDGASKDGTVAIIKEYAVKDPRVRYISEPDKGIYDAFNKGCRMAKGEWVHYLGDDDELTENGISDLMKIPDNGAGVVSGHCHIRKIDGSLNVVRSVGLSGCHQGKLTRRSVLEQFGGFNLEYKILADKDLYIRMGKANTKAVNVDTFVAYFSMGGISQRFSSLWKRTKEHFLIYKVNNCSNPLYKTIKFFTYNFLSISYRKARCFTKHK